MAILALIRRHILSSRGGAHSIKKSIIAAASLAFLLTVLCACSAAASDPMQETEIPLQSESETAPAVTPAPTPSPPLTPYISILGKEYKYNTRFIDLSGITSQELSSAADDIARLQYLRDINLLDENRTCFDLDSLLLLKEIVPDAVIHCSFDLFGKAVCSEDEEIIYEKVPIGNDGVDRIREAIPLLHNCSKLVLSDCGIDNDIMAELRDDYPDIKIVWRIVVHGYGHMTDIERIRTNLIDDNDAELLKYFTDVKYIDMGHRKKLTNWEFLKYMPHLQVLIVSITDFSDKDLWYLTECHELEFLEMASCHVTDLSPLAECTSLEHLCIGNLPGVTDISPLYGLTNLKRLRISQDNVPQAQKDEITRLLPDCQMLFGPFHWGFAGYWRYDDEGNYVDRYALLREQFDYDDYPWAGWVW